MAPSTESSSSCMRCIIAEWPPTNVLQFAAGLGRMHFVGNLGCQMSVPAWDELPRRITGGNVRGHHHGSLRDYAAHLVRWFLSLPRDLLLRCGSPGASTPSVVFDGDSITVLATPAIHQVLDPSYDVAVLAVIGIRINQALPALESALKLHPYAVVENLGTNDALQGGTHPEWVSSLGQADSHHENHTMCCL